MCDAHSKFKYIGTTYNFCNSRLCCRFCSSHSNSRILINFQINSLVFIFVAIIVILVEVFTNTPSFDERNATGNISSFPAYFGTTLFALVAIGLIITLENNMKTPKSFGSRFGVLNVGMFVITLLYAFFGFVGYWKYGAESDESITLNLPSTDM